MIFSAEFLEKTTESVYDRVTTWNFESENGKKITDK